MRYSSALLTMYFLSFSSYSASFYVDESGSDSNSGSASQPYKTIQKAINSASDGDYIKLQPGVFNESIIINKEVKIEGAYYRREEVINKKIGDSVICGDSNTSRVIQINASNVELRGVTVDGNCDGNEYGNIGVFISSTTPHDYISDIKLKYSTIKNMRGECVRFRYFVKDSEVSANSILNCGTGDFGPIPTGAGKNAEGIYIGTSYSQWVQNLTNEPDLTQNITIKNNMINTQGNECVDIKEGASDISVEGNNCLGQREENAACFRVSGNDNSLTYNRCFSAIGSGVLVTTASGDPSYAKNNVINYNRIYRAAQYGIEDNGNGGNSYCSNKIYSASLGASDTSTDVTAACNP